MPQARRHPGCFKPDRAKLLAQHAGWEECAKAVARCATRSILRIRYDFIRSKAASGALGRCRARHPRSPSTSRFVVRFTVFAYLICRASLPAICCRSSLHLAVKGTNQCPKALRSPIFFDMSRRSCSQASSRSASPRRRWGWPTSIPIYPIYKQLLDQPVYTSGLHLMP
jgi:hypothetical protein